MVAGRSVYQPSVADTRAYTRRYTCSPLHILATLFLSHFLSHPLVPLPTLLSSAFARAFNPPRPYNSNVGRGEDPFDWYSHTRYYFYTCDTASVSGDKGSECMTARMGHHVWVGRRTSILPEPASNFLLLPFPLFC